MYQSIITEVDDSIGILTLNKAERHNAFDELLVDEITRGLLELEADPRVLSASNYPMQPWLDVAEGGWSTIVVTDNDPALAELWREERPGYLIEDLDVLLPIAWAAGGTLARFEVHGIAYREVRRFALGEDAWWVLCARADLPEPSG